MNTKHHPSGNEKIDQGLKKNWHFYILMAVILGPLFFFIIKAIYDPNIYFLVSSTKAQWIQYRFPSSLYARPGNQPVTVNFTKDFELDSFRSEAQIRIKALTQYRIWINDQFLGHNDVKPDWKKTVQVLISKGLKAGNNHIRVEVRSERGPPALWVQGVNLPPEVSTGKDWLVCLPGKDPKPATLVREDFKQPIQIKNQQVIEALKRKLPFLSFFSLVSAMVFCLRNIVIKFLEKMPFRLEASIINACLIFFILIWFFIFINNISKKPALFGYDLSFHLEYFQYILKNHSVPLAGEGFATYHPPLFYFLSVLAYLTAPQYPHLVLKLIPFMAGIGQIILAYFTVAYLFPQQTKRQILAIAMTSIIPMNLYMAHFFTNEGLSAFFISLTLLTVIRILVRDTMTTKSFILLGVCMGLSLLTKFTGMIIFIVILVVFGSNFLKKSPNSRMLKLLSIFILTVFLIAGWVYIRNWIYLGKPFPGNWDATLGFSWWQDPGFQTFDYYFSFGDVFLNPYFVGLNSFFDAIYATFWGDSLISGAVALNQGVPWDQDYLIAVYLLALPATLFIFSGALQAMYKSINQDNTSWFLLLLTMLILGWLIVYANIRYPYYSVVKAFFALGALLPFSFFFVLGFDALDKWLNKKYSWLRPVAWGWLGTLSSAILFCHFI